MVFGCPTLREPAAVMLTGDLVEELRCQQALILIIHRYIAFLYLVTDTHATTGLGEIEIRLGWVWFVLSQQQLVM